MKKIKVNVELKFIVSLVFAVIVAIFAIQNASSVDVKFFLASFSISQAVVILGSAIIGAIIAVLLGLLKQIKLNMKIKQFTKEIDNLNKDNNDLQTKINELNKIINKESKIKEEEVTETDENQDFGDMV